MAGSSGALRRVALARGRNDGVEPGQVVLADRVLVGRVATVTASTCEVLLATDPSFRIRATVSRDDQDVDPTDGHTPESGVLRYIPFLEFSSNTVFRDVTRPSSVTIPLVGSAGLPIGPAVPSVSMRGLLSMTLGMMGLAFWTIRRHARVRP